MTPRPYLDLFFMVTSVDVIVSASSSGLVLYNLKIGLICAAVSDDKPPIFGFFQTLGNLKAIYCSLTSHSFDLRINN